MTKILLYINIFFLQSYLIRFQIGGYPSNLQEILIGVLAIVFLIELIRSKKLIQTIRNLKHYRIIPGFMGLTILSLILILTGIIKISPQLNQNLDLIRHLKFLFFAIVLGFIFLETFRTGAKRENAIGWMGIGALIFGIFSVTYNLLGYNVAHDYRILGPLDAAVYLAYYLAPFFIFFAIKALKNPGKNLLYAILLGLLIISTGSMGAIGASFLVLLIYIVTQNNFLKTKYAKLILGLIALLVIGSIFYTKILPTITTEYSSLDERGEIWQTSIYLLKEPANALFGVGFGQFQTHYESNVEQAIKRPALDYIVLQPHNIFLLFIFQYGILGLFFLIFIIHKIAKKIFISKESDLTTIASFMVLYFLIHGLIDTPFFKNDLMIILIIFLEATNNFWPQRSKAM